MNPDISYGKQYQNPAESPKSRHIFPTSLGEARHSEKKCARMRTAVRPF
jgi:hypothetical protein